ncbi:MAG: MogA/MoaB family molybdenum cofactor biosynthesis protein [Pyrinomonadaceae bacterium]
MDNEIRAAVLTISDTRTFETDISGARIETLLKEFGAAEIERLLSSDDFESIRQMLLSICETDVNLAITTGGTGFAPRDNTPEATLAVVEKVIPGIPEAIRAESAKHTKFAMISRAACGIRNGTLIINFPGSAKGVEQCFEVIRPILAHSIDLISGRGKHGE